MNKRKWILIAVLIFVTMLSFLMLKNSLLSWQVIDETSELLYFVNEDGKTCTITGIGTYKRDTLYLDKSIDGYQVTDIGDSAFENSNIKFVYMPSTLKTIGTKAFANCTSLVGVYNLDKCTALKSIGDYAFERCLDMNRISLPNNMTSIGDFAFSKCYDLKEITMPDKLMFIGNYAFQGCISLNSIVLPQGLRAIGESAFESCQALMEIYIPNSVTNIGIMAFAGCNQLKSILVDRDNSYYSSIQGHLYNKDGTILIQTCIVDFSDNIVVKKGVTSIESYAFRGQHLIESITFPSTLNKIGSWVIYDASMLTAIHFEGAVKEWLAINKMQDWDEGSANYTIYCTDGQITKDGTITYYQ